MAALLDLDQISPRDVSRVGGKAAGLAALHRAGLPVPPAFVIPIEAAAADVTAAVARQWVARARALGERLGVRSSGVGEDGLEESLAGQFHTELGVSPEEVPAAVKRVWQQAQEGRHPTDMAVVVQRLVNARSSGVMFTVNPLNGSWREMVVESVLGLGLGLVSGQVQPHWTLVRRPHRLPGRLQRLWSRVRLSVMQWDCPTLPERWEWGPVGGTRAVPVSEEVGQQPVLTEARMLKLCRLGLRAERTLGGPQDIEWCEDQDGAMWLVQSRPITRTGSPRPRSDVVWTRRFIGERWSEPVTPLGWSILEPLFDWYIGYPGVQARYLGGGSATRLVQGRIYLNTTVFRHLAFKWPGAPTLGFMAELVPPDEERNWRSRHAVAPDVSVYLALLRATTVQKRWTRFSAHPLHNPDAWQSWRERLQHVLPEWSEAPKTGEEAVSRVQEQVDWIRSYIGIHLPSLLFANLFYQLLSGALARWVPDRRSEWLEVLGTSPPGNQTLAFNGALWELAGHATETDLTKLAGGKKRRKAFQARLDRFVEEYGHRSEASWEICAPRWASDPSGLAPLLRAQRGVPDPRIRAEANERRVEPVLEALRAEVGRVQRRVLDPLIRLTRRYLLLRENQRFWFDHLLYATQRALLAAGDHLVERRVLRDREDVRWLHWPEVVGLLGGERDPQDIVEVVERRRVAWLRDAGSPEPPIFLVGDAGVARVPGAGRVRGLPISPGRVRGRVRVVRSLSEADRLLPGEILVTRAVDPAWTPLFQVASGAILQLGGMLSHGAVVAREYGLPLVVAPEGGLSQFADGQEVTVDGTRGLVWT